MITDHDGIYHLLFSHPAMVEDLTRSFVAAEWVADLDFDHMERVNTKFHSEQKERREEDVIWRIPTFAGSEVYLYLPIGFQSNSPHYIATRVGAYIFLLWQHIEKENKLTKQKKLPPVFPIILYNGDQAWTAPTQLTELIDLPVDSPLWQYQPTLQYYLIDQSRYLPDDLLHKNSLSALVFLLEHCRDPQFFAQLLGYLVDWFKQHTHFEPLKKVITLMVQEVIQTLKIKFGLATFTIPEELKEIQIMLLTRMESWFNEREQRGEQRGVKKGEANLLIRLITRRFGEPPAWVLKHIDTASIETLESWGEQILEAQSLAEIFGSPPAN